MKLTEVSVKNLTNLIVGYQYDHKKQAFKFIDVPHPELNQYLKIVVDWQEQPLLFPLKNNEYVVGQPFTLHCGFFKAQLMVKDTDGNYIANTRVFNLEIMPSIDPGEKYENVDPNLEIVYDEMKDLIDAVNGKLESGDFNGLSAYEVALENGFKGSELEWLESLKGSKGDRGEQGERGEKGETGETGQPGKDGTNGIDGVSPIVQVTEIENGHKVSITDKEGLTQFDVMNGQKGDKGDKGEPYEHSEEFTQLAEQVKQDAESSKESEQKALEYSNSIKASSDQIAQNKADIEELRNNPSIDFDVLEKLAIKDTATGNPCVILDSADWRLQNMKIYGESTQLYEENIVPTPERPIQILSKKIKINEKTTQLRSLKETSNLLFDDSFGWSKGYVIYNTGLIADASPINNEVVSDFQPIKPNTSYGMLIQSSLENSIDKLQWCGVGIYDENKNFITRKTNSITNSQKTGGIFTTPSNAKYFRFSYRKYTDGVAMLTETSVTPTTYVSPTVRDYKIVDHETKTSKIIRNIKYVTFNGSEDTWCYDPFNGNRFHIVIENPISSIKQDRNEVLANMGYFSNNNIITTSFTFGNDLFICTKHLSTDEFKEFLSINNLEVQYQLKDPVEEEITYDENDTDDYGYSYQDSKSPSISIPTPIISKEISEIVLKNSNISLNASQINIGDTLLDYQEPQEQLVTLSQPITLSSTKDRKITDIVDSEKIERNIKKIELDGSSDEKIFAKGEEGDLIKFSFQFEDIKKISAKSVICDKFPIILWNEAKEGLYTPNADIYLVLKLKKERLETQDVQGFRKWLYKNPLTMCYPLEIPTFEPLPKEDQEKIKALKMYYPNTVIHTGAETEVTYIADPKLYIDKKLQPLNTVQSQLLKLESEI